MSTWLEFDRHNKKHYYRYDRHKNAVRSTKAEYNRAIADGIARHKKDGTHHNLPTNWVVGTDDGKGGIAVAQFRSTPDGHMRLTGSNVDPHNSMVVDRISRVVDKHLGKNAHVEVTSQRHLASMSSLDVITHQTIMSMPAIVAVVPAKKPVRVLGIEDTIGGVGLPIVLHMRGSIVPVLAVKSGGTSLRTTNWKKDVWEKSVATSNKIWGDGQGPAKSNTYKACESTDVNCRYALMRIENPLFKADNYKAVHALSDRMKGFMPDLKTSWQAEGASYFMFDAKDTKEAPVLDELYKDKDNARILLKQLNNMVATAQAKHVALTIDPTSVKDMSKNFLITRKDDKSPYTIKWWRTDMSAVYSGVNDLKPVTPGLEVADDKVLPWHKAEENMIAAFKELRDAVSAVATA
jgi:hypothetical protein